MTPSHASRHARCRQTGTVLIIALIMLLLLTMLGVGAMRATTMEERMAGNVRDATIAFQAAEAALRSAEEWIAPLVHPPSEKGTLCTEDDACDVTVYADGTLPEDLMRPANDPDTWWTGAATMEYEVDIAGTASKPRYVLEHRLFLKDNLHLGSYNEPETGRDVYSVTARATGQTDDARALLQTAYAKRFN